ncbi:MAG: hypothetical protein GXY79_01500 [Chloroflexi bacterium]|nr:hypothetical protein [Chloroflexota bacterium]
MAQKLADELEKIKSEMAAERTKLATKARELGEQINAIDLTVKPATAILNLQNWSAERDQALAALELVDDKLEEIARKIAVIRAEERQREIEALQPAERAAHVKAARALLAAMAAIREADEASSKLRKLGGPTVNYFDSDTRRALNWWLGRVEHRAGAAIAADLAAFEQGGSRSLRTGRKQEPVAHPVDRTFRVSSS